MGTPTKFPEANLLLVKPESMTDEECTNLPVHKGDGQLISCWQLSEEEIAEVALTGKIFASVFGEVAPPIWVGGNPFPPTHAGGNNSSEKE